MAKTLDRGLLRRESFPGTNLALPLRTSFMKNTLFAFCSAILLTSCAGVKVTHTDVATGATNPRSIYIRPFDVAEFRGRHHSQGERPIRRSLAPAEFSDILKQELEKIAPAMVLADDQVPQHGWLVEGELDLVNAGSPIGRALPGNLIGLGSSKIMVHVRVIDLDARGTVTDSKDKETGATAHAVSTSRGAIVYEFDVAGGSRATGKFGSVTAPGLGYAVTFDYRNAAERIYEAISPDPHRYGVRTSPSIR
ncbi:MAG: hypothetical protein QOD99_552 [Chthoniobacter sp.]|jgi:hypothetical protein|nr:hypothetical protein [Chthoniobacter sp.]